jgi:hypothetical protein
MERPALDRRGFIGLLGVGLGGIALEQAIPFNRVWSFPKKIVIAPSIFDRDFSAPAPGQIFTFRPAGNPILLIGDEITIGPYKGKFRVTEVYENGFSLVTTGDDWHTLLATRVRVTRSL